ncbi:MAG TPA: AMP-binding protein [Candidatus Dormibacteraeota bacterium]
MLRRPLQLLARGVEDLAIMRRAGLLRPVGPAQLLALGRTAAAWGLSPAAAYPTAAAVAPDGVAIIDDAGEWTFGDIERRSNSVARGLAAFGVGEQSRVGLLARNHHEFVEVSAAAWKLGARSVYLNTSFARPQVREVIRREEIDVVVYDAEFADLVKGLPRQVRRVAGAAELIAGRDGSSVKPPRRAGSAVILTSGTTGAPKGAQRSLATSIDPALALLSRIPLRAEEPTLIAAPLFHAWGFAHLVMSFLLQSTLVLQSRFDAEQALAAIERHRVTALVAVPVMLQRIMELPARTRRRYDTTSLRVVAVSGSALAPRLAHRFMDAFGDVLYNLYGSTEVAWAAIATPAELRAHPDTAGRPPRGTIVHIYREDGSLAEPGETGQIFVGSELLFEGYTGGGSKEKRDGLMTTGDLGHFDAAGLLFVEGRSDDMIVSGGENVYPGEVEEVIARLPAVAEAAVVGVPDADFGQALRAFVVKRRGAKLTEDEVRAHVRALLARYKVPKSVVFVDDLPRNATGKVVRRELTA